MKFKSDIAHHEKYDDQPAMWGASGLNRGGISAAC
jgi:hypothetical protein